MRPPKAPSLASTAPRVARRASSLASRAGNLFNTLEGGGEGGGKGDYWLAGWLASRARLLSAPSPSPLSRAPGGLARRGQEGLVAFSRVAAHQPFEMQSSFRCPGVPPPPSLQPEVQPGRSRGTPPSNPSRSMDPGAGAGWLDGCWVGPPPRAGAPSASRKALSAGILRGHRSEAGRELRGQGLETAGVGRVAGMIRKRSNLNRSRNTDIQANGRPGRRADLGEHNPGETL